MKLAAFFTSSAELGAYRYRITGLAGECTLSIHGLQGYLRGLLEHDRARIDAALDALEHAGTWHQSPVTVTRLDPVIERKKPRGRTRGSGNWSL